MSRTPGSDVRRRSTAALTMWVSHLRERMQPTVYVDWSDVPDEPESPYRARLAMAPEHRPDGVEVRERDVVRGEMRLVYEIRCACGKRWFDRSPQRVQLCPRCERAVLLRMPE